MKSSEFFNQPSLEQRRHDAFITASARLIAHGEMHTNDTLTERSLHEDRPPLSFTHQIAPGAIPADAYPGDFLEGAELHFTEACKDPENPDEPFEPTITLTVLRLNNAGQRLESEYQVRQESLLGEATYSGTYMEYSSAGRTEEDLFDDRYFRDCIENDLAVLESAINSLEPAPSMETYLNEQP